MKSDKILLSIKVYFLVLPIILYSLSRIISFIYIYIYIYIYISYVYNIYIYHYILILLFICYPQ